MMLQSCWDAFDVVGKVENELYWNEVQRMNTSMHHHCIIMSEAGTNAETTPVENEFWTNKAQLCLLSKRLILIV